jgi:hypothetical protein
MHCLSRVSCRKLEFAIPGTRAVAPKTSSKCQSLSKWTGQNGNFEYILKGHFPALAMADIDE